MNTRMPMLWGWVTDHRAKRLWLKLISALMVPGILSIPVVSQASNSSSVKNEPSVREEADPWETFNAKMFWFNRNLLDQYVLKPVARGWNFVLPDPVQDSLRNAVDNTQVLTRLVNSLAQGNFAGAGREVARFGINSTIGIGGLFDVAKIGFGIDKSDEDTGQTLGFYGIGPGPYLVLPLLPPMDVRDGIGGIVDAAMNPLNYIIPFAAEADAGTTVGTLFGITATDAVNSRSLNLKRYEGVEEVVVDLYSAVRNAYLQKREAKVRE